MYVVFLELDLCSRSFEPIVTFFEFEMRPWWIVDIDSHACCRNRHSCAAYQLAWESRSTTRRSLLRLFACAYNSNNIYNGFAHAYESSYCLAKEIKWIEIRGAATLCKEALHGCCPRPKARTVVHTLQRTRGCLPSRMREEIWGLLGGSSALFSWQDALQCDYLAKIWNRADVWDASPEPFDWASDTRCPFTFGAFEKGHRTLTIYKIEYYQQGHWIMYTRLFAHKKSIIKLIMMYFVRAIWYWQLPWSYD
jgi:hypothetical protein